MPLAVVLAVAALLLSGCRIDVTAELDLRADGSGTAVLDLALDRELLARLDELGLQPVDELEEAVAQTPDWDLEVLVERGQGGLRLRLEHEGDDPAGALAELSAGLAPRDPGLLARLEVTPTEEELELAGHVELAAPHAPGVLDEAGAPVGPDRDELRARMDDHVAAALVVRLPGEVRSHEGAAVEDAEERTLRWELPVDERVEVRAVSEAPMWPTGRQLAVAAGGSLLVVLGLLVTWRVRRRR